MSSEFSCDFCSAYPRHPCYTQQEATSCPNCPPDMRNLLQQQALQRDYPEVAAELAEYRRRFGPIR